MSIPRKILYIFLPLFVLGCKKSGQPVTSPPVVVNNDSLYFKFIPMDSVKWYVHCQGEMVGDTSGYHWDSSRHFYTTVVATGEKINIGLVEYFVFKATTKGNPTNTWADSNTVYVREDADHNTVFSFCNGDYLTLYYTRAMNDEVDLFYRWVRGNITTIDSFQHK